MRSVPDRTLLICVLIRSAALPQSASPARISRRISSRFFGGIAALLGGRLFSASRNWQA
jgi:hypothetical protein